MRKRKMNSAALTLSNTKVKTILLDIIALLFIAFAPALSHMFAVPIYMLEPMRIMLILSIVHTSKKNSYLIALALPLFSFFISTHPSILKTLLICSELLFNLYLFTFLLRYLRNSFAALLSSILISKLYYYAVKFALLGFGLMDGGLVATPLFMQAIVALGLSTYLYFFYKSDK